MFSFVIDNTITHLLSYDQYQFNDPPIPAYSHSIGQFHISEVNSHYFGSFDFMGRNIIYEQLIERIL